MRSFISKSPSLVSTAAAKMDSGSCLFLVIHAAGRCCKTTHGGMPLRSTTAGGSVKRRVFLFDALIGSTSGASSASGIWCSEAWSSCTTLLCLPFCSIEPCCDLMDGWSSNGGSGWTFEEGRSSYVGERSNRDWLSSYVGDSDRRPGKPSYSGDRSPIPVFSFRTAAASNECSPFVASGL